MDVNWGYDQVVAMFQGAITNIRANIKELSALDAAIGDGDHGVAMGRAGDAVEKAIQEADGSDLKSLLQAMGWGVMSIDGGSTGPLLGSLFMGMSEGVEGKDPADRDALAALFKAGLANIQQYTKAQVGDKTLMDALIPAVGAIQAACEAGKSVPQALTDAAQAAEKGALATKTCIARFGRAKNLGDRTLGHQDPGARSIALIFSGFAQALQ